ncbi:MAG: hypothetical protein COU90_01515 [Candidatus Ryanbacteria bacterium CG10_big_fil_rev_8_21_14_0_10_43_42]|uniref:Uncharacterized protein n=1 Tax=Candidatus Ryanbacteria bacterium CG10_big_fil_rev_8_21_14_0_10_43_42 TaxID=1974864 RepID=A0A2M8KX72_9BACT|nr:MAG: hypothetical protein COU90_01515 [Candidatus Ryanbacteria bacterium CG10_big_fil_rev_8_21_14_0_10_43_42]
MIHRLRYGIAAGSLLFPFIALAQVNVNIEDLLADASDIINILISFLILLATFLFLLGIVRYILASGDEEKRKEARGMIVWGIIFLAVMVAVWGFVNLILDFIFGQGADSFTDIPLGPNQ